MYLHHVVATQRRRQRFTAPAVTAAAKISATKLAKNENTVLVK